MVKNGILRVMVRDKNNKNFKVCDYGNVLWERIDDDTVKILGANGQDYEIGFNYIDLICKKCGKRICKQSEIAEIISELFIRTSKTLKGLSVTSSEEKPYTLISSFDRENILKTLSEAQGKIFRILMENDWRINQKEIAKKIGLPKDIVAKHIKVINEKIKKIKPNFKKRILKISRE